MSREEQQSPLLIFHVMLLFFFDSGKGCQVGSLDGEMTN